MEKSIQDQSRMSYQPTLLDFSDAIFSQESESGITLSTEPDGLTIDESGQEVALANLSPRQAKAAGLMTSGTYGRRGSISSMSDDLTQSLANRLRQRTDLLGSTLFRLTWKASATPSHRLIFRLRASGHRTSGKDCFGWPTPTAVNREDDIEKRTERGKKFGVGPALTLNMAVNLTHWEVTPSASDGEGGVMEIRPETSGKHKLRDLAHLAAPWITPQTHDVTTRGNTEADHHYSPHDLLNQAELASWPTPCQQDGPKGGPNQGTDRLPGAASLSGWATPQTADTGCSETARQGSDNLSVQVSLTASGTMPNGSTAPTKSTGQLNPAFSRWLMGLPDVWGSCGDLAMRSTGRLRKPSSKAISKTEINKAVT